MALISENSILAGESLFKRKGGAQILYLDSNGRQASVAIDLFLEENIKHEATVSQHSVEFGSDITTNIKTKLRTGTLRAFVSNWSVNSGNFLTTFTPDVNKYEGYNDKGKNRAVIAYRNLVYIHENKKACSLVTSLGTFTDCYISNIDVTRTGRNGEAQEFVLTFQKLKIVLLQTKEVPINPKQLNTDDTAKQTQTNLSKNKQSTKAKTPVVPADPPNAQSKMMAPVEMPKYNTVPADATYVKVPR
jgi:hypothetical protein